MTTPNENSNDDMPINPDPLDPKVDARGGELLPCPFCDSLSIGMKMEGNDYYIYCKGCHIRTSAALIDTSVPWQPSFLKFWNNRPQIQQLKQEVFELKDQLIHSQECWERQCDHENELESQLLQANKRIEELERREGLSVKVMEDMRLVLKEHHAVAYKGSYYPGSQHSDSTSNALRNATMHLSNLSVSRSKDTVPTTEANSIKPKA